MDDDLKEALEAIKDLRAALQLAHFEPRELTDDDARKLFVETEALLRKHGETDDIMDDDNGE